MQFVDYFVRFQEAESTGSEEKDTPSGSRVTATKEWSISERVYRWMRFSASSTSTTPVCTIHCTVRLVLLKLVKSSVDIVESSRILH